MERRMAKRWSRRRLFEILAGLPLMSGLVSGAAAQAQPKMRVRPGDPAWPSDAAWDELNRQVEGRLIKVPSPAPARVGSYVWETDFFQPNWQDAFWGENYPRLRAIKDKYDPEGLFFLHHGVGSEVWSADGFTRVN
jgi:FAD/FMN-containing dehydrogenase